jgi:prophage regulatory protein
VDQPLPRYFRPAEVAALFLVSTATVWRMVARGELPRPVRLSPRRVAWREDVVRAYLNGREAASA